MVAVSGIRGSPAEAVMDSFPVWGAGRWVDGDPIIVACVRLVQFVIEGGRVVNGGIGHLASRYVGAIGRVPVLQVDSATLFRQLSASHE